MTDAAVAADSAPVTGAPLPDTGASFNEPLPSQIPPDARAKDEPAKPPSLNESIDRAFDRSAKDQEAKAAAKEAKEPKVDPKADAKDAPKPKDDKEPQPRENGRFAAKDQKDAPAAPAAAPKTEQPKPSHTAEDAPARFTETARQKWHQADPEIRGEVLRMQRELTDGYQKHKAKAEAFGDYEELDNIAKQHGKKGADVFREYYQMEQALQKNPIAGLNEICSRLGLSLRDVAAHVMGQTPDQQASQQDATIRELREQVKTLSEQIGGVTKTVQQQQHDAVQGEVAKFAAGHPRFEELADDIAMFMQSGRAKDLSEAYDMAERLNPAPAKPAPAAEAKIDPPAQPDKGQKSIHGAPGSDSTPRKRVAKSLDEALDGAFRAVG